MIGHVIEVRYVYSESIVFLCNAWDLVIVVSEGSDDVLVIGS